MSGQAAQEPRDGWREAVPEIVIAAIVVAVAAVAGYAAAGLAGTAVVVACAAVAGLAVMRGLGPRARGAHDDDPPPDFEVLPATFTGYWRKRAGLVDGTQSGAAYDAELRGTLQHLLAARLAEHHGVSLRDDPAAARRLLCPRPGDERLWYWVDPARPRATAAGSPGIPPRTLARLIERLERLGD
jgi:hypothetical protein